MVENEEKQVFLWGMFCHLAALLGFMGVPFGHIIGPLVVWLIKRDDDPFINDHGKESLNFQISMTIYGIVAALLVFVVVGIILLIAVGLADLIMVIIASVKAANGERYRYPCTIRFIK